MNAYIAYVAQLLGIVKIYLAGGAQAIGVAQIDGKGNAATGAGRAVRPGMSHPAVSIQH